MRNQIFAAKSSFQAKFMLLLVTGAVPLLTNCSKAKYDETSQQPVFQTAPIPQARPLVAPQALPVGSQTKVEPGVGRFKDSAPGPVISDDDHGSRRRRGDDRRQEPESRRSGEPSVHIEVDANPRTQPCPVLCSGVKVETRVEQIPAPTQSVSCVYGDCHLATYHQSYFMSVSKVDILFAIDSNVTLTQQKIALRQNIRNFLERLPRLDYNIALLNTQDNTSSLYFSPGHSEPVVHANLNLQDSDRSQTLDRAADDMADRMASLNSASFIGTSDQVLKKLDQAVSLPDLRVNQDRGFFRNDAGLIIVTLTDERVANLTAKPIVCVERSEAREVYRKIANLKSLGVDSLTMIENFRPLSFIGFAMVDSDAAMNAANRRSATLELLHLGDADVFDLAKATIDLKVMAADLRFAADRFSTSWMKRKFQIRPQSALNPGSVCLAVGDKLIPTNFVPEINEVRMDYRSAIKYMPRLNEETKIEVLWCENGQTRNNSNYNEFAINPGCQETLEKFRSSH